MNKDRSCKRGEPQPDPIRHLTCSGRHSGPEASAQVQDFLRQDAIAMNLQRAAEWCLDMANHLVRKRKLNRDQ